MGTRIGLTIGLIVFICMAMQPSAGAQERFIDNGDGTVTDLEQGLMWAGIDNHGDIDWHEALQWVTYTFPYTLSKSYENWRLPTLAELQSLVTEKPTYEADCGQWLHIVAAIKLTCGWVWTSETDDTAPTARVFNFDNVYHYTVRQAHRRGYRALAVRNLK